MDINQTEMLKMTGVRRKCRFNFSLEFYNKLLKCLSKARLGSVITPSKT